jgi:hypothetical protein
LARGGVGFSLWILTHALVTTARTSTATAAAAATAARLTPDPFGARLRHWPRGEEVVWESATDSEMLLRFSCAYKGERGTASIIR